MIQIDEPPDVLACSTCMQPLDWVLRHRDRKWYAIVRIDGIDDPTVVKLHSCQLLGAPRTWANLPYQPPEERRGPGWQLARRTAAAAKQKLNEKEGNDVR